MWGSSPQYRWPGSSPDSAGWSRAAAMKRNVARQLRVQLLAAGADDHVAARVAEGAGRGHRKRRRVEESIDCGIRERNGLAVVVSAQRAVRAARHIARSG